MQETRPATGGRHVELTPCSRLAVGDGCLTAGVAAVSSRILVRSGPDGSWSSAVTARAGSGRRTAPRRAACVSGPPPNSGSPGVRRAEYRILCTSAPARISNPSLCCSESRVLRDSVSWWTRSFVMIAHVAWRPGRDNSMPEPPRVIASCSPRPSDSPEFVSDRIPISHVSGLYMRSPRSPRLLSTHPRGRTHRAAMLLSLPSPPSPSPPLPFLYPSPSLPSLSPSPPLPFLSPSPSPPPSPLPSSLLMSVSVAVDCRAQRRANP